MIRRRAVSWAVALACLGGFAAADPVQDRLDQIAAEITHLFELHADGQVSDDELTERAEALMRLEMQVRTGTLTPEDVAPVRWRDFDTVPVFTAGYDLVISGLPPEYDAQVTASLPDGRRLPVSAVRTADQAPTELTITMPVHPDGVQSGDRLTFHFGGAELVGSLEADLAPVLNIDNALPRLMQVMTGLVITDLQAAGISPEALLAQLRTAPDTVDPAHGHAALLLWLWSEASRGNPALAYIRDGRLDTPHWTARGAPDVADAWNIAASAALQNLLTPELMMQPVPEVLQKISVPRPAPMPGITRANLGTGQATDMTLPDLAELVAQGRALKYRREAYLASAKSTHKVLDAVLAWTPQTGAASLAIGGGLTLADQALRNAQRDYPSRIAIQIDPTPDAVLLADDSRIVSLRPVLIAKSEPYQALTFADGADVGLLLADLALRAAEGTKMGKVLKLGKTTLVEDAVIAKGLLLAKEAAERTEKADTTGRYQIANVPGRTWRAPISVDTYHDYFSIHYDGEARTTNRGYFGKACWDGSDRGINAMIRSKSAAFGGAYAQAEADWGVQDPNLILTPETGILEPGQNTTITFRKSGAEAQAFRTFPPALGALSAVAGDTATYTAPAQIAACSETMTIAAEYPTGAATGDICAPPPQFSTSIFIKKGDAKVLAPTALTCRDGEVLGFTVAHSDGKPVQCVLEGPGRLTMAGDEGLLDCPVRPSGPSAITCYTGQAPGQCAPVIPIKRIFPEFAVAAIVTADRRAALNDVVEPFFDQCSDGDMTRAVLELMDLGTGAADILPVDPVSNPCPKPTQAGGGGVAGGGSSASQIETFAEGRYVARWPLGEGRDVSVSDSNSYRHSPPDSGRGPGDRSVLVSSDIAADVVFDGPEAFTVETRGRTTATSIRDAADTPDPSGGFAQWVVWRRIEVTRATRVTATISTRGPAISLVQALPVRLESNVPLSLLAGFDQNLTPVMMVGNDTSTGVATIGSDTSSVILPGPRSDGERLTYLIRFGGGVAPLADGPDTVTAASRTTVEFEITPVQ